MAGSEEAVFRVYSAAAQGDTLAVMLAATEPKPPGLNFQGSEASVVIKLDAGRPVCRACAVEWSFLILHACAMHLHRCGCPQMQAEKHRESAA